MSTVERQGQVVEDSVSVLVSRASRQLAELVHEEMQLARAEMTRKGKRFGKGGGLFGTVGVLGLFVTQVLMATCIAAVALVLPVWVAALTITGGLAAAAAAAGLAGKRQAAKAGAPIPEQALDSVKAGLAEIEEKAHR
ncbi:phage holin family protein [Streptomyces sp. NPDC048257]|uniref:phage holin family protein n=1 Tax=Streptomyces sp. NPDC048257 TaxID=3365526 RepID=UPI003717166F